MNRKKKIISTTLLCESFTNRSNILVMVGHAKNERDRKQTSPFVKVGRVGGQTIRGWIRHAMEKLLISNGVSVCHPISRISATSDRNKEYFKEDLAVGYHSRGDCADRGGCLIYQLFGDLDFPGNLIVPSAYFYPTTTGNGTATKDLNRVFRSIGGGRIELAHVSPRARAQSHQTYMSMETIVGIMIKAPMELVLIEENPDHEIALLMTLEFLKKANQDYEYDHLLGGMRGQGYGRAALLPMVKKSSKKKTRQTLLSEEEIDEEKEEEETESGYKIQFELTRPQSTKLEAAFQALISREKAKFQIMQNEEKSEVEAAL